MADTLATMDELCEYINTYSCDPDIYKILLNFYGKIEHVACDLIEIMSIDPAKIETSRFDAGIALSVFFLGESFLKSVEDNQKLTSLNISIPSAFNRNGPFTRGMFKDTGDNRNCVCCINCQSCSNCEMCINCINCINCWICTNNINCSNHRACHDCEDSADNQQCSNCVNCDHCYLCTACNNLTGQISCTNNVRPF